MVARLLVWAPLLAGLVLLFPVTLVFAAQSASSAWSEAAKQPAFRPPSAAATSAARQQQLGRLQADVPVRSSDQWLPGVRSGQRGAKASADGLGDAARFRPGAHAASGGSGVGDHVGGSAAPFRPLRPPRRETYEQREVRSRAPGPQPPRRPPLLPYPVMPAPPPPLPGRLFPLPFR